MLTLNKLILGSTVGALLFAGCSSLKTDTSKTYFDPKIGTNVTETTSTRARTFFDAKSGINKLSNKVTGTTSGTTIGDLNQESSGTNAVNVLKIIVEGVPVKAIVP